MRFPTLSLFVARGYVLVALVLAGVVAPPVYALIPWLTLLLYFYLEFRGGQAQLKTPLNLFLILSLPLLFEPLVGAWASPWLALPAIPLLDDSLRQSASACGPVLAKEGRRPTRLCLSLGLSLLVVGLVALALGSWSLLLGCALGGSYLAAVIGVVLYRASKTPATAEVPTHRVVAGNLAKATVMLANRSALAGRLYLVSPHPWLRLRPTLLLLDRPTLAVEASFVPPLAGPTTVVAQASFIDPWGLIQADFRLALLELFVIPRARYAEWLARRYLAMSRPGGREAMTSAALASRRASRRGTEFYGLRSYQPGDSVKTIDWKHTLKLQQVIVKEFLDTGTQFAVLMVNLSVADEEEKDKLAYSLLTTALTLARENIPSALAVYSHQGVVANTGVLDPRQGLIQALSLARQASVQLNPMRYLGPPDVSRLRSNIYRLRQSSQASATRLADLLELEEAALGRAARQNPATEALAAALAAIKEQVNVVVLSACNHDAEALAISRFALKAKGYRVLQVELGREGQGMALSRAHR